jgi:acyl-CoA synthetase (AMP-forming)/AMP-acid ligase II
MGVMLLWEALRARSPSDIAVVGDVSSTFAGLLKGAAPWRDQVRGARLGDADLVLVAMPTSAQVLSVVAGIQAAGAVPAGVNVALPAAVVDAITRRAEPAAWIGPNAPAGITRLPAEGRVRSSVGVERADDAVALVVFTSGTSAVPRGRAFTKRALAAAHEAEIADDRTGPGVLLGAMAIGNLFMATRLPSAFARGGAVALLERWDAMAALRLIREHGVDTVPGVPAHFADLLAQPDGGERVRRCVIGGSAPPRGMVRALRERFGCEIVVRYSSTEAGAIASTGPIDDDGAPLLPLPGVEIAVEDGHVLVRSPMASRGEWNGADSPAWIDTGDLGVLNDDGSLLLRGRADDAFARGGTTIAPAEIEQVLQSAPGVDDVAVICEEDARLGMRAIAFLVGDVDIDAVRAYAREHLAAYLVPDAFRVLDALPMTPTGKPDRRALRDL